MNIQHLKYIIEVARVGSISQAAENLYMGQPNLSKAIKELEQTLNITIFKRTPKGAEITPKGQEFLRYAKAILCNYDEMEALGRQTDTQTQIMSISVPRASYIVDAFISFTCTLNQEKNIQLDFLETNALRAIHRVADGRSGFGIIRFKTEHQRYFLSLIEENTLKWRQVLEFEYKLLFSAQHPLAKLKTVPADATQPFIEILHGDTTLPCVTGNTAEPERGASLGNKKICVYERESQFELLARVPGTYMWASPMPQDLLSRNGLVQRPCEKSPVFTDILIHQHHHRFSPHETAFLAALDKAVAHTVLTAN